MHGWLGLMFIFMNRTAVCFVFSSGRSSEKSDQYITRSAKISYTRTNLVPPDVLVDSELEVTFVVTHRNCASKPRSGQTSTSRLIQRIARSSTETIQNSNLSLDFSPRSPELNSCHCRMQNDAQWLISMFLSVFDWWISIFRPCQLSLRTMKFWHDELNVRSRLIVYTTHRSNSSCQFELYSEFHVVDLIFNHLVTLIDICPRMIFMILPACAASGGA